MAINTVSPDGILSVSRPEAGQEQVQPVSDAATRLQLEFPSDTASMSREGDHLVFAFEDESRLVLENFYSTFTQKSLPDFVINGTEVAGADFFSALDDSLMPAAGPAAAAAEGGGRFADNGVGDLLGGIDALGGLDYAGTPRTSGEDILGNGGGSGGETVLITSEVADLGASPAPSLPGISQTGPTAPAGPSTPTGPIVTPPTVPGGDDNKDDTTPPTVPDGGDTTGGGVGPTLPDKPDWLDGSPSPSPFGGSYGNDSAKIVNAGVIKVHLSCDGGYISGLAKGSAESPLNFSEYVRSTVAGSADVPLTVESFLLRVDEVNLTGMSLGNIIQTLATAPSGSIFTYDGNLNLGEHNLTVAKGCMLLVKGSLDSAGKVFNDGLIYTEGFARIIDYSSNNPGGSALLAGTGSTLTIGASALKQTVDLDFKDTSIGASLKIDFADLRYNDQGVTAIAGFTIDGKTVTTSGTYTATDGIVYVVDFAAKTIVATLPQGYDGTTTFAYFGVDAYGNRVSGEGTFTLTTDNASSNVVNGTYVPALKPSSATDGNDVLYGNELTNPGNDGRAYLWGEGGNDKIFAGDANTYINGGTGNDTIVAGHGNNEIVGGTGSDFIQVGDGDNSILLGTSNYTPGTTGTIIVGDGNNTIKVLELDATTIYLGDGANKLTATASADLVVAGNGDNIINVGSNDFWNSTYDTDTVYVGHGNNTINTGVGDDIIRVGNGNNTIDAGSGNDMIELGSGNNIVYGGAGNDTITVRDSASASGSNILHGGDGNDKIYGGVGNDTLYGDAGNDLLVGGKGDDVLFGGGGADTFLWNADDLGGTDIIKDFNFSGGDRISLARLDAGSYETAINGNELTITHGEATQTIILEGVSDADMNQIIMSINTMG